MLGVIAWTAAVYIVGIPIAYSIIRKDTYNTYRVSENVKTAFLWPAMIIILGLMLFYRGDDISAWDGK